MGSSRRAAMLHQTPCLPGKPQPCCCFLMWREGGGRVLHRGCHPCSTGMLAGAPMDALGANHPDTGWVLLPHAPRRRDCVLGSVLQQRHGFHQTLLGNRVPCSGASSGHHGMPCLLAPPCEQWREAWLGTSMQDQCFRWPLWAAFVEATWSIPPATASQTTSKWWVRVPCCRAIQGWTSWTWWSTGLGVMDLS